jgi:hypothetical protein
MGEVSDLFATAMDQNLAIDLVHYSPEVLSQVIVDLDGTPHAAQFFSSLLATGSPDALDAAIECIAVVGDPGAMTEIVRLIVAGGAKDETINRRMHAAFLNKASDRHFFPRTRAQALLGALYLAQEKPPLLRSLQAFLLDLDLLDDPIFLHDAGRVAGLVVSHVPDQDIRAVLESLLDIPEAEDEVSFNLGLLAIGDALDETRRTEALALFERAMAFMRRSVAVSESREDARLYEKCLDVLLRFQNGGQDGGLKAMIEDINVAAFAYVARLLPNSQINDNTSWLGISTREGLLWCELSAILTRLDTSLLQQAWLNAASVIEGQLVRIYDASRSILRRTKGGGVEAIVRPRIVGRMQENLVHLSLLDQWIVEHGDEIAGSAAIELRRQIERATEGSLRRNPTEATVAAAGVAELVEQSRLTPRQKSEAILDLENAIRQLEVQRTSPILLEIFEHLRPKLMENADYRNNNDARDFFNQILYTTISFVASRDNQTPTAINGIEYLFNLSDEHPPVEADMQRDYYGFLQAAPLRDLAQREVPGVAHGRVDVYFSKDGIRTVAELKKTHNDLTLEGLAVQFGLQTTAYQRTSQTFCILMVLDLFNRSGGGDNIRAQVDVVPIKPPNVSTTYSVVVFRLQGRKRSPSSL